MALLKIEIFIVIEDNKFFYSFWPPICLTKWNAPKDRTLFEGFQPGKPKKPYFHSLKSHQARREKRLYSTLDVAAMIAALQGSNKPYCFSRTFHEMQTYQWDLSSKAHPCWHWRGWNLFHHTAQQADRQWLPAGHKWEFPGSPCQEHPSSPSCPCSLSHISSSATAAKVRLAVTWKGVSTQEQGQQAEMGGGVQEKGGKERGNSLNENLAAAKSLSTLTQHGVWISVARPWLCPLLLHYYFIDFRGEYKSRAAWLP